MTRHGLPFQYEAQERESGLTALGGLPLYLELAHVSGLADSIRKRLCVRGAQGWSDVQVVTAIVLLNLAGGDCVEDIDKLEHDEGFAGILRRAQLWDLPRHERRDLERRWRKARERAVPSPSAIRRYLEEFHDPKMEGLRPEEGAFIPAPHEQLRNLMGVHKDVLAFIQGRSPRTEATLDVDATLIETHKATAEYSYKHFKAYQPLNVWWAEQGLVLHTEFRDGNVPAGFEVLRVVEEALEMLPAGVTKLWVRSDTAAYQHAFLKWLLDPTKHPRFGVIEFAISCDVTVAFKKAVAEVPESEWHPYIRPGGLPSKKEWAEVCFVPDGMGFSKRRTPYRFIATRELLEEQPLPGLEVQQTLPFPTMRWTGRQYKVFGIVTSLPEQDGWTGNKVITWLHGRCGKSEEAHSVMKEDLAGGKLPSGLFGANAAWWWMMILAFNLNTAMKRLVLGGTWVDRRLKTIRFHIIHVAGRLLRGARQFRLRLACTVEELVLFTNAKEVMTAMAVAPSTG